MKAAKKVLNAGFLLLMAAFLLGGLANAALRPKDINTYENRPANYLHKPTVAGFLDASFQSSVEAGLSDQVLLAQHFKKAYNDGSAQALLQILSGFLGSHPQRYITLRGAVGIFNGDCLVYYPRNLSNLTDKLDRRANGLNALREAHPDWDLYVYYIERDTDINFQTVEKVGVYEYLRDQLALPGDHVSRFSMDSFDQFQSQFFHTDHHWGYQGSYAGYQGVAELLGISDPLLEPVEEVALPYTLSGSKAVEAGVAQVFQEMFTAYRFDYPPMTVTQDGQPVEDYGRQNAYFACEPERITYGSFYGGDPAEITFDTGREDREDILILGESYDNAILKLLASHFHHTYSVDLRYYGDLVGDFSLSEYVREHPVDKVLFIGSVDFFVVDEFMPGE